MENKFQVGDIVRVKSLKWYNENKDSDEVIWIDDNIFVPGMVKFCGEKAIVSEVKSSNCYMLTFDGVESDYEFTDSMLECIDVVSVVVSRFRFDEITPHTRARVKAFQKSNDKGNYSPHEAYILGSMATILELEEILKKNEFIK